MLTSAQLSSNTSCAPETVMFNRPMRVTLPEAPLPSKDPASLLRQDSLAKKKMKLYADRKAYVVPSDLKENDTVLVKRDPSYKSSGSPYDPEPYRITKKKGSMVTARRDGKEVTRKSSFFKKVNLAVRRSSKLMMTLSRSQSRNCKSKNSKSTRTQIPNAEFKTPTGLSEGLPMLKELLTS